MRLAPLLLLTVVASSAAITVGAMPDLWHEPTRLGRLTRGARALLAKAANPAQTIGFGGWPYSPWRQLPYPDNQRVARSSATAAVGQPLAVSRVATAGAVPCEALVQQKGNYYQCNGGWCTGVSVTFKNWQATLIPSPWSWSLTNPTWAAISGPYNTDASISNGVMTGSCSLDWQALAPNGGNSVEIGWQLTTTSQETADITPSSVSIGGTQCGVTRVFSEGTAQPPPSATPGENLPPGTTPAPTAAVIPAPVPVPLPPAPPPAPPGPPYVIPGTAQVATQAVSLSGTQIIGVDGNPVQFKGLNYFGFENGNTAPDGIWQGSVSITHDLVTIMRRHRLLGFNAIRLPFSMKDLFTGTPRNFNSSCTITSDASLQAATTHPGITVPTVGVKLGYEPTVPTNTCNYAMPNDSVFNRFLWFINFLARNGWYVLIDNHLNSDGTILDSSTQWLAYWKRIMEAIAADPVSVKFVMYDILNEPDSRGIPWIGQNGALGMTDYYIQMMDQGYQINPNAVYFVEGTAQSNINANWGDGFCTAPSCVTPGGRNDPNKFFSTLLTKPYLNKVVISPHVYPPTITNAASSFSGAPLNSRLSSAHGYLNKAPGYCSGGTCKTFPIAVGEFGTRMTEARDLEMMPQYANYLNNLGNGADGLHEPITSWFWWCWNVNSGDTGGMVDDDWLTVLWRKPDYLETIGLQPYYAQYRSGFVPPPSSPSVTVPAPQSPAPVVQPGPSIIVAPSPPPPVVTTPAPLPPATTAPQPNTTPATLPPAPLPVGVTSCPSRSYMVTSDAGVKSCQKCVSSAAALKTVGGASCVFPNTFSARSTACRAEPVAVSVRDNSVSRVETCVDTASTTVKLLLPLGGTAKYTSATWKRSALRLAGTLPVAKSSKGTYLAATELPANSWGKRTSKLAVTFRDPSRTLRKFKGQVVQLTGVISRSGLDYCFTAPVRVCTN
mmetsp:Transcript_13633/g.41196  ORF Transcript_13633/g.41196 Transcript_13633/m.41196 type:complete len:948 (-) Transcript_13633:1152-3995(-)|eukprot:CAMPEP_0206146332 /NCGR_PEP_ID=MMETSP1473-20131121/30034_1 /ASSEMBLY_ACC=CAM_ASM_001109 /TAXON_ID=1461547 /ORGANISM="Stichococcus sp, Strain RCC1054" /LENGTH=947 /DNA_ID=CAMNT_0053542841 /DNA_START=143 /DNA_END=2986 /DNA_ORIENTATION=-